MAENRQGNDVGEWLSGVAQNSGIGERSAPLENANPVINDPADNQFKAYGGLEQSFVDGLARQLNRPIDPSMGRDQIMALDHLANGGALTIQHFGDMSGIPLELRAAALGANQDLAKMNDGIALRQQWEAEAAEKARVQAEERQSSMLAQMAEAAAALLGNKHAAPDPEFQHRGTSGDWARLEEDLKSASSRKEKASGEWVDARFKAPTLEDLMKSAAGPSPDAGPSVIRRMVEAVGAIGKPEAPWSAKLPPINPPPVVPPVAENDGTAAGRYGLILDDTLFGKPRELPDLPSKLEGMRNEVKLPPLATPPFAPPRMNG